MATHARGAPQDALSPLLDEECPRPTEDTLFGGSVVLFQPPRGTGYRTNVDALLLAAFARAGLSAGRASKQKPVPVAYDLGAGVGGVGLALLRLGVAERVVFVEVEPRLARMALRNVDANKWTPRGEVIRGDVREVARLRPGQASLVVCNPPYLAPGRGQVSHAQLGARVGVLQHFVEAARLLAGRRARVCVVYPAQELTGLLSTLAAAGLHAKRMRLVHGTPSSPARVALVEARAARAGGLIVLPALVEQGDGGRSLELEDLLLARSPAWPKSALHLAPKSRSSAMAHAERTLR
jgi:tRNA1Val (adenine37-N6)-methyltransferase